MEFYTQNTDPDGTITRLMTGTREEFDFLDHIMESWKYREVLTVRETQPDPILTDSRTDLIRHVHESLRHSAQGMMAKENRTAVYSAAIEATPGRYPFSTEFIYRVLTVPIPTR